MSTTRLGSGGPLPGWTREGSPYHPGEQAVQARAGARELAERMGRKVIREFMPDQHRAFFAELPFLALGGRDGEGRPWATMLFGPPGFAGSPHPRRLEVAAALPADDPLASGFRPGAAVGVLGIQFHTRRRNRMNGRLADLGRGGFAIAVDQSFGNCAKYIQARTASFAAPTPPRRPTREGPVLSPRAAALVRCADTFFISSVSPSAGGADPVEGADVNHRGGRPGFVRVSEEGGRSVLMAPDFAGNSAFSTFGNLLRDPRAGVLFLDFETGDLLTLTGEAEVMWDAPELDRFAGAQRFLRFRVGEGWLIEGGSPMRWSAPQPAPQLAATGAWAEIE